MSQDQPPKINAIREFLPYLWPKDNFKLRAFVVLSFVCLVVAKLTAISIPLFLKSAIDALTLPELSVMTVPLYWLIAYGVAKVTSDLFADIKDVLFSRVEQNAVRGVGLDIFKHLHSLSMRFHLDRKTGAVSAAIERGVKSVETFLTFSLFIVLPAIFEVTFITIVISYIFGWMYALITIVALVLYITYTIRVTLWRAKLSREQNKQNSYATSKAVDSLINYETVKYFCNEDHELHRYDENLKLYEAAAVKNKSSLSILNAGQMTIISTGLVLALLLAATSVVEGSFTIGEFILVNSYLIQLYFPLGNMGFAYREMKQALVNMEEMFVLLHEPMDIQDEPQAKDLVVDKGEVVFEDVCFAYNPDRLILKGISFKVPAGKTVAVVGATGAGKSTLSRILFRFYDVCGGRVLIDGQDIAHVTQSSLRQAIGIVPQDTVLFNESIYYNLAYGRPDATREELERAAELAHIHDFVMSLPEKYDTMVGERGLKLSGGEKQRVAIARTILKRPKIFLFDEATSALDSHTEKEIQKNLAEVSTDNTALIIAHRLSTVVDADQIIVLDKGDIVERGTHDELLAHDQHYAKLWKKQQESRRA